MKFATFQRNSEIRPGFIKGDYIISLNSFLSLRGIDFSCHKCLLPFIRGASDDTLHLLKEEADSIRKQTLMAMISNGEAFEIGDVRLMAPIIRPPAVFCLGFNFRSHAPELKRPVPEVPVVFMKPSKAVVGQDELIILPRVASRVDYEVELAVVMGKGGRYIPKADAYSKIFGYTILNDVTARDIQQRDFSVARPWLRSKGFDTFAPMGPYIVTGDELGDPMDLELKLTINGEVRQQSKTKEMLFDIPSVVEYISSYTTLEAGAVIAMGTPENVGQLHDGELIEASVEKIGTLRNMAVLEK